MATLLSRLGAFSARRRWLVVASWIAALALAGGAYLLGRLAGIRFQHPGTATAQVTDRLTEALPGTGGATGTVVFRTADGSSLDAEQREQIADLLAEIGEVHGVDQVIDPFATQTERTAQQQQLEAGLEQLATARQQLDGGQAQLDAAVAQAKAAGVYDQLASPVAAQQAELDAGAAELTAQSAQLDAATRLLEDARELRTVSEDGATALGAVMFEDSIYDLDPATKAEVTGILEGASIAGVDLTWSSEIATSLGGLIGPGEIIGLLIAGIVLVVMLGSLLPASLPLISSLAGIGVGVGGSLAFSGVVDMSSVTPVLGVMLGLAVGIDYALFILNRHRRQLMLGMGVRESIALAVGTSGSAVAFAGSTVIIALLALGVTGIPFLAVMGVVGAVCVLIAVLAALTLTPALLSLAGERVLSRRARARLASGDERREHPVRPMRTWRAVTTVVVAAVALLVIAIPALSMRLGLPDGSSDPVDSTQYQTYSAVAEEFGAGQNGALLVVAEFDEPLAEDAVLPAQADLADELMAQDDVVAVAPIGVSDDRDLIAFQVVPADGPSSESTEQLVAQLRALEPATDGVTLGVAGQASGNIDVSAKLADALPAYLAVVVGLSLLIMVVVFRSLLVPLLATGGFLLSLAAAFGAVVAVYQWGWLGGVFDVHDPGPVLNFAPVILIGVLFGLAMDYQLFLVSGMREAYVHGLPARQAVVAGFRNGRAVVTAAAIIMIAVFGGFVFSHLAMVRPLGFGMAIGVLFDAFVVRMLIVPALMHLAGDAAWWLPRWLDRILPRVDVEGASLSRPGQATPASEPARR
ncbi:MAG: MMPL family transporter [Schumannella sp.]